MRQFTFFFLILTLSAYAPIFGQGKKIPGKKPAVSKAVLSDEQRSYLADVVKAAGAADGSYGIEMTGELGKNMLYLDGKSFGTKVRELLNIRVPECETIPRNLAAQVTAVKSAYSRLHDFYLFEDNGAKGMNYVQYAERSRSIREEMGFSPYISGVDALRALKAVAQASTEKLRFMVSVYPRVVAPDREVYSSEGSMFMPPVDGTSDGKVVDPCAEKPKAPVTPAAPLKTVVETPKKTPSLGFSTLATLVGDWRFLFSAGGTSQTLIFSFMERNGDFFAGVHAADGTILYGPVIVKGDSLYISFHVRTPAGQLNSTEFECTSLTPTAITGRYTGTTNGVTSTTTFFANPVK